MKRFLGIAASYGVGRLVVAATMLVPGVLGADLMSLGRIELLLASVTLAWAAGPLGTPVALSHELFRDRRRDWWWGLIIAGVGAGVVAGVLGAISEANLIGIAVLVGVVGAWQKVSQGRLRVDDSLVGVLVATGVMVTAFVAVLLGGMGWGWAPAEVTPLALLAALIGYVVVGQRFIAPNLVDDGSRLAPMLRFGLPLAVGSMFSEVVALADRFLIEWLIGIEAVGAYGLAYRWVALFGGAGAALATWWQAEAFRRGGEWTLTVARRAVHRMAGALSVTALIVWYPLAWLTAKTLTVPLDVKMLVLVLGLVLGVVGYVVGTQILALLAATGRSNPAALAWGSGAVVNVVLNLAMIPTLGLVGAAFATTAATTVVAGVAYHHLRRAWREREAVVEATVAN